MVGADRRGDGVRAGSLQRLGKQGSSWTYRLEAWLAPMIDRDDMRVRSQQGQT